MSAALEVILFLVAAACCAEGAAAWPHDRMAACGFWTATALAVMLALTMATDRWGRRP